MSREPPKLTPEACRAGRAVLRWTVSNLADQAGVRRGMIAKVENGGPLTSECSERIVTAFRSAGVEISGIGGTGISWSDVRQRSAAARPMTSR